MKGKYALRYRLSTMLLLVTLAGLFLGYAHWRRSAILRESSELETMGVTLLWTEQPSDKIWPLVPAKAELNFAEISPHEIEMGATTYSLEEAKVLHDEIMKRLDRLGVKDVVPVKDGQRLSFEVSTR